MVQRGEGAKASANPKVTGELLAARVGLDVKNPLYRRTGNWYHIPQKFPTALFDDSGYIFFDDEQDFKKFVENDPKVYAYYEKNQLSVAGGIAIRPGYRRVEGISLAEEISQPTPIWEGAKTTIVINAYERNRSARNACIDHWGLNCAVCKMTFRERYGAVASGFIHVHHLVPLKEIGESYEVDPVNDLRPVCPNCHAVLHMQDPPISIEALKERISDFALTGSALGGDKLKKI